ncbi:MAG: adenylyltransferase/cytidyltransferase family protein [Treponema sp.]|nr:adenylyltransferase/cytidyltransferase family protein [Treponema sp.]
MDTAASQIIYEMPQGILNWYDFREGSAVLLVYNKNSCLMDMLKAKKTGLLVCASVEESEEKLFQDRFKVSFDYIVAVGALELSANPVRTLAAWRGLVKDDGFLLLGTDNRLGMRYLIGERDPFTDRLFDGVEGYRGISPALRESLRGRCYSKAELEQFLEESGWTHRTRLSVLPNLDYPQLFYSEDCAPEEVMPTRYFPKYRDPSTVFMMEEYLYDDFVRNGIFHGTANSFLFICSAAGVPCDISMVTVSMDRGHEDNMATVIRKDRVEKIALHGSCGKLKRLAENCERLKSHGVKVVDGTVEGDRYVLPYVDAPTADRYFQNLARVDPEKFIAEMDRFKDLIMGASETVREDAELGPIVKDGYPDLVPLNCFYKDGDFFFFDQEFSEKEFPVFVTLFRFICIAYGPFGCPSLPIDFFFKRYGMADKVGKVSQKSTEFLEKLRNQQDLAGYNKEVLRDPALVMRNKERMGMSEKEWEEYLYNPFAGLEGKKLFLFGSGNYAKKFIAMYRFDYDIVALLDNNPQKWNTELDGYRICRPEKLFELQPSEYKVIICIKDYLPVLKQLKDMGIAHVGVYQGGRVYPGRQACAIYNMCKDFPVKKKYHIGYVAGVFDLFHLGHLNMFRRAKEQCDYLIVGVVSDAGVRDFKHTEPFVPFDERIEMVRSCRFVDEAVEIPYIYRTTKEAYEKYHFDVQFSGSDYVNDPGWLAQKAWLESQGAELVFFPYTQQTSSSKIKALIDKGLA